MDYKEVYESWLGNPYFDEDTKNELKSIAGDDNEIKERFYQELKFGTAGLRGVIGAGTNRMNIYTVRKATQGLANYITKAGKAAQGVAIAFDSRHMSPEFADESALCLAANGIKAYVFESLRPTPELSYAVRELKCAAGINITASHTMVIKYTGRMAHRLHLHMILVLWQKLRLLQIMQKLRQWTSRMLYQKDCMNRLAQQ